MENQEKIYRAGLIIVGNEILSGRTLDKNTQHIGVKLNEVGVTLSEVRIIPDIEETIISAVRDFSARFDYVFTTGGIGPTHDDITAPSVAKAFDVDWVLNDEAQAILLAHYGEEDLTEARLRMAKIPVGASLIPNPVSSAPGFKIKNVYVMAGVPRIMQGMLDHILPTLAGGKALASITITIETVESEMAAPLAALQDNFPHVDIGSYPSFRKGELGVSAVLRGRDDATLNEAKAALIEMLNDKGVSYRIGETD